MFDISSYPCCSTKFPFRNLKAIVLEINTKLLEAYIVSYNWYFKSKKIKYSQSSVGMSQFNLLLQTFKRNLKFQQQKIYNSLVYHTYLFIVKSNLLICRFHNLNIVFLNTLSSLMYNLR